ncbi:FAD-dependent oxidoreductase, partial [Chromobacterium amazonense]
KTVGIIGAGPAGLACADVLVRNGVKAVVYDRYEEIGGLLTFGIPEFKLEKDIVRRRREILEGMGVEFVLNTEVGKDISFDKLMSKHDAVFMGMGAYNAMRGGFPGEDSKGVLQALPYLINNVRQSMGTLPEGEVPISMKGKRVLVLGGGDTAMDCIRTAIRQGAVNVKCIYRRGEESMPGSKREVANAKEEGADFLWNYQPLAIEPMVGGTLAVRLAQTQHFPTGTRGRGTVELVPGSEMVIQCDRVIIAFGFMPQKQSWCETAGIMTDKAARVKTNLKSTFHHQTSHSKIFAAGDMVTGSDLVVTAVFGGRQAALEIVDYLANTDLNVS